MDPGSGEQDILADAIIHRHPSLVVELGDHDAGTRRGDRRTRPRSNRAASSICSTAPISSIVSSPARSRTPNSSSTSSIASESENVFDSIAHLGVVADRGGANLRKLLVFAGDRRLARRTST